MRVTRRVQLFHELRLGGRALPVPPLAIHLRLRLDFFVPLPDHGVVGHFVGGLENGLAPVRREGVGLGTEAVSRQKHALANYGVGVLRSLRP